MTTGHKDKEPFDPYHIWLGIPPEEQPPNCYRLLGIPLFEANLDVISSAADRQMAHLRSFQTSKHSVESQVLLNQVAKAKVRLLRADAKAAYDAELRKQRAEFGETLRQAVDGASSQSQVRNPKPVQSTKSAGPSRTSAGAGGQPRPRSMPVARPLSTRTVAAGQPSGVVDQTSDLDFSSVNLAAGRRRRKPTSNGAGWIAAIGIPAMIAAGVALWAINQRGPVTESVPQVARSESGPVTADLPAPAARISQPEPPAAPAPEKILSLAREPKPMPTVSTVEAPIESEPRIETRQAESSSSPEIPVFVAPDETAPEQPEVLEFDQSESPEDEAAESDLQEEPEMQDEARPATQVPRLPIPDETAQASIRKQLDSMHDADDQQTPRAKLKLAHELMEIAGESQDSAEQYVLLQTAAELAAKAGDALLMLEAIEACEERFEFDGSQAREAAILRFADAASTSERIRSLTAIARRAIEQAAELKQWDSALSMANAVARATQRPQGREFRKQAVELRTKVRTVCEEQQQLAAAEEALRGKPDDAAACQTLGAWQCFVANDWERGLPLLAKGTDTEIREVAEQDLGLSKAATVEERLELAESWWTVAGSRKGEVRDALQLRAAYWYRQCLSSTVSGLHRLKIEKRLEEAAAAQVRHQEWVSLRTLQSEAKRSALWSDG